MQNKDVEKLYFDKFGEEGYKVFHTETYFKFLNFFKQLVEPQNGQSCLEIGCGSGAFTEFLATLNLDLTAIDISDKCINYAKQHIKQVSFQVGDVEQLDFDDNTFDIVVSGAVIHHFADNLFNVIKEIYRVLKFDGKFFAYEPNRKNPIMYLYRDPSSPFYSPLGVTKNERPLDKDEIARVLYKAGFSEVKIFATSGIFYRYVESKIGFMILPLYNFWERIFSITPFAKDYGSFLIIFARKK
ncbi:MAG: class I SAM-dependent methyltransferase [Elusimicrobiota bacterium]|nr:class I SAM-dependent methyltransferase [Elusimicrobiota bacterium]